jgi:hypothetical protein
MADTPGYKFHWKSALKDIIGGTMGGMGLVAIGHPFGRYNDVMPL